MSEIENVNSAGSACQRHSMKPLRHTIRTDRSVWEYPESTRIHWVMSYSYRHTRLTFNIYRVAGFLKALSFVCLDFSLPDRLTQRGSLNTSSIKMFSDGCISFVGKPQHVIFKESLYKIVWSTCLYTLRGSHDNYIFDFRDVQSSDIVSLWNLRLEAIRGLGGDVIDV